jgi:hypothetical protein
VAAVSSGGTIRDDDVADEISGLRLGRLVHVVAAGLTSAPTLQIVPRAGFV